MTMIGKILAFLNLLVGVAMAVWSVSLYTQRPGWFDVQEYVIDLLLEIDAGEVPHHLPAPLRPALYGRQ